MFVTLEIRANISILIEYYEYIKCVIIPILKPASDLCRKNPMTNLKNKNEISSAKKVY